jgi:outer membrane protein assembly factor BamB
MYNNRWSDDTTINANNVQNLVVAWNVSMSAGASFTPIVLSDRVIVPITSGELLCLNKTTGLTIWRINLSQLMGVSTSVSRTPSYADGRLVIGTEANCIIYCLDVYTGNLLWQTTLDTHYAAHITQSATIINGVIYQGTSSWSELPTNNECCSFQGKVVALNLTDGGIIWQTKMLPENDGKLDGYAGASGKYSLVHNLIS